MLETEKKLEEMKSKAQQKFNEIAVDILDGPHSLTQLLVKAYRHGHDPAKAIAAFSALSECVNEAHRTYQAAIAQPEPKISQKQRVVL